jgi:hypothetical protein
MPGRDLHAPAKFQGSKQQSPGATAAYRKVSSSFWRSAYFRQPVYEERTRFLFQFHPEILKTLESNSNKIEFIRTLLQTKAWTR